VLVGTLACLGDVAGVGSYEDALALSVPAKFTYGEFRYLHIDALIRARQAAGRDRDLAALKFLLPIREKTKHQFGASESGT